MTKSSYPLKLIFLLKRLKRFLFFFEWHSWDLAEVFVIWNSCRTVIRNAIQEKASKLPRHPGSSFEPWVAPAGADSKHCTPCPEVTVWSSSRPVGSPCHLRCYVRKKVRQPPRECSARSELAVRVTEIMPELRSPPTFLFFFVGWTIHGLFGWDWQELSINASSLRTVGFPFMHGLPNPSSLAPLPDVQLDYCAFAFGKLSTFFIRCAQKYWRKCHAMSRLLVLLAHCRGCNTELFETDQEPQLLVNFLLRWSEWSPRVFSQHNLKSIVLNY